MSAAVQELTRISTLPPTVQQIVLAGYLASNFATRNAELIVVGGAAVQYYSNAEYVTKDLDAVVKGSDRELEDEVMGAIGFHRKGRFRHYEHPTLPFVVEFPPEPIEVASRVISAVNTLRLDSYEVRVIRIEDIIMDRITAAVEWRDKASLAQAKLLWLKNKDRIDRKYLTQFAREAGYLKVLKEIMKV